MRKTRNHLVLFLDIDGVLNSGQFFDGKSPYTGGIVLVSSSSQIDMNAVALLNTLINKTQANIVISSTWRIGHSLPYIQDKLRVHGFKFPEHIIGCTPELSGKTRGKEIIRWLSKVPVDAFVIFDDDEDMTAVVDHFIKTEFETGLQQEHVDRAIALFDKQIKALG